MSVKVSAVCWKVPLPATEKLVLMRLADFANDAGFNIWPAVQTIAQDCGVGIRAVQLTLKKLVGVGILVVMNQGGGRGRATEYAIDLDLLSALRQAPPAAAEQFNGHEGNGVKGANSESSSGFNGENPASDDINPAPRSPHPLLPVKEEGGGGSGRAHEVATLVGGLTGLKATKANVATVGEWLAAGCDPKLDIYPAVVEALPTAKTVPGSFAYFTNAIGRHHATRTSPQPEPSNVLPLRRSAAKQHCASAGRAGWRDQSLAMLADSLEEGD